MAKVLCLGEALIDRLLPWGADRGRDCLGGAPANGACALARLGSEVGFIGRLGRDRIGEQFAQLFQQRGVDTAGLQWDVKRPSRVVLVRRDASGDRSFGGFEGDQGEGFADEGLDAAALPDPLGGAGDWLAVGTIPLAASRSAAALRQAVAAHQSAGGQVVVDVNWRPTFWGLAVDAMPTESIRVGMDELLAQAQLLKLAAEEAQALFGSQDPSVVAAMLPQKPGVVITDGAAGVSWALGPVAGSMPSYPVAVVDTTGAGDAFLAGLLHRLCQEPELLGGASEQRVQAALAFASACGALVCQGVGAIDPQPVEADVFDFIGSHSGG